MRCLIEGVVKFVFQSNILHQVKILIQPRNHKDYQNFYAISNYLYVKAPRSNCDQK